MSSEDELRLADGEFIEKIRSSEELVIKEFSPGDFTLHIIEDGKDQTYLGPHPSSMLNYDFYCFLDAVSDRLLELGMSAITGSIRKTYPTPARVEEPTERTMD